MSSTGNTKIALSELLDKLLEMGGSDLHLRIDTPPRVRVHGHLNPLEGYSALTAADTKRLAYSALSEIQQKQFEEQREFDFSLDLEMISRFRVNVFMQKGTAPGFSPNRPRKLRKSRCFFCELFYECCGDRN